MPLGSQEIKIDLVDEFFMRNRYEIDVIIIDSNAWAPTFDQPDIEEPKGQWEPDWSKSATLKAKVKSID